MLEARTLPLLLKLLQLLQPVDPIHLEMLQPRLSVEDHLLLEVTMPLQELLQMLPSVEAHQEVTQVEEMLHHQLLTQNTRDIDTDTINSK